ncbi:MULTISPECIES: hypothetical protein [Thermus]|nr:hypothetical protein [Thermus brockianus]
MKKVAIIGAGYVGLTTGLALAYAGHRVRSLAPWVNSGRW